METENATFTNLMPRFGVSTLPNGTQGQMFGHAERRSFNINDTGLSLLFGPNPITDDELKELIAKNPEIYDRFAGYIGTR